MNSREIFERHFSPDALREVAVSYLAPTSARGVDGLNYDGFMGRLDREVELISRRALRCEYVFSPYRQKLVVKDAGSFPRRISIATMRDKVALRALSNFLADVFGYARPQHTHPVISSLIKALSLATKDSSFVKIDIKSFYDEINHAALLKNIRFKVRTPEALEMIRGAITTPTGKTVADAAENNIGVPQGLSISNILASIYLHDFDQKFTSIPKVSYHRYVDDILCITGSGYADELASSMSKRLRRNRKLTVHPMGSGKSQISHISEQIDYLGYRFHGSTISVRTSTEKKFLSSIMRIIYSSTTANLSRAVWRINLRISGCRLNDSNIGWIIYFSQINDLRLLSRMDAQIKKAIRGRFGEDEYGKCKTLIRAYHEVKYNHRNSNYIVNFDTFTLEQMVSVLRRLYPERFTDLERKSEAEVRRIFNRVVSKEVRELERDTLGGFS